MNAACLPLQLERLERDELDGIRDREGRRLAHDDGARLRGGLEPRGRVDDIARDRPALGGCLADERLAAVHAYPKSERARFEPDRGSEPLEGGDERETRPHRALRVVIAASPMNFSSWPP